ncbi:MAG: bifunctional DNA-formamidopyrimidine glycosylase/DNA-(apurinic or apyrimidinic site) lyase [Patescibacteria group bacterium]|nr:bifunctional DNA-formamidopyrimidine glycosylase/DNA-(apurinic or apyrimidinic site) lyase [Patescibacteria group bacterium]
MPELPEVETIRRGLEKKILGLTLKKIEVLTPKSVLFNPQKPQGQKVLEVWRKAKMLGINLTGDISLVFHLKMTGQLILTQKKERVIGGHPTPDMRGPLPNSSTRAVFEFDSSKLYFNDQRRFGWVKLFRTSQLEGDNFKKLGELGPEPLEPGFSWELLKTNLLKHKSKPIKVVLMDQSVVSGVGNIYASEVLFAARIDPRRKVSNLSDREFKKLYQGIKDSLELAIEKGGSTRAHFVNIDGEKGYFLDYANVYGKEGQACKGCSGKVEKIIQAGRGTYFCPSCQK